MWREGFDLTLLAWVLNALALAFGVFLGARGLIDPRWAAKLVRLKGDEQGGGFAEFRATYGGLFFFSHAAALYFTIKYILGGESVIGIFAAGAAAALAAAWIGTAGGRGFSMLADKTRTRFNLFSAAIEAATGLMIAAPWLTWNFQPPG